MASVTFSGTGELTPETVNADLGTATVVIIEGYTSIGDAAFVSNTQIASVTIGNSVTSIGEVAFWFCINLTSVTIGNSVTSIGGSAFKSCTKLTSVAIGNSVTSIGYQAFFSSGLTTVYIANGQVISGITFQSPASGVSFFGKTVTTDPSAPAPAPAPAAPSVPRILIRSLFTNNAQVYYKPHSLASGGIGSVRNCRFKSKKT